MNPISHVKNHAVIFIPLAEDDLLRSGDTVITGGTEGEDSIPEEIKIGSTTLKLQYLTHEHKEARRCSCSEQGTCTVLNATNDVYKGLVCHLKQLTCCLTDPSFGAGLDIGKLMAGMQRNDGKCPVWTNLVDVNEKDATKWALIDKPDPSQVDDKIRSSSSIHLLPYILTAIGVVALVMGSLGGIFQATTVISMSPALAIGLVSSGGAFTLGSLAYMSYSHALRASK